MKKLLVFIFIIIIFGNFNTATAQMYGGAIAGAGTTLPATCRDIGTLFWKTDTNALYVCDPANTWTSAGGSGVPVQSDCSGITSGICVDSDDGYIYVYNGDTEAVELVGYTYATQIVANAEGVSEAYGIGWSGDSRVPQKADIYNYIHGYWDTDDDGSGDDETITPFLNSLKMNALSSAPSSPVAHHIYLADGVTWDPSGIGIGRAYYVVFGGPSSEIITDVNDRTFAAASNWANVDFSSYDESGDLTVTASASGQSANLAGTYAPMVSGQRYRLEFDVANLVSTFTIKDDDETKTICQVTANGTNTQCEFTADDSTGGIEIISDSATSSADFDNFSLISLSYVVFMDEYGIMYASSIATPTLEEDELDDDTGDRLLLDAELKNKILTNGGMSADLVYDFPQKQEGWNFIVVIEAAYEIDLCPYSGEQWYLNGTQLSASECIVNSADTVGEEIACYSTQRGVYCKSSYSNWTEETP